MLAAEADRACREAEEAQAIADRLAEEARVANAEAQRARQRMETRAVIEGVVNPN
jgi:hypothetical protein